MHQSFLTSAEPPCSIKDTMDSFHRNADYEDITEHLKEARVNKILMRERIKDRGEIREWEMAL